MVGPTIIAHGTEEQKEYFLPRMLNGEQIWCQLFSEPGAGSDLAGLATRAERDGDEWVVNGQKVWTSGAHFSDWGILLARTDWDVPKHRGITYFLVDMRSPGIEIRPLRQITGYAHFNEVFLTDVRIPDENMLGPLNGGWGVTQTTLANERAMIGGGMSGVTFDAVRKLAQDCGRTDDPVIRQELAQSYTRFEILKWLGQRARAAAKAGQADRGRGVGDEARDQPARRPRRRPLPRARRRRRDAPPRRRAGRRHVAADVPQPVVGPDRRRHRADPEATCSASASSACPASPAPTRPLPFRDLPRN